MSTTDVSEMIRLGDIAHGRSGDKGDHANVAIIAYADSGYAWLRDYLTADRVRVYFSPLGPSKVERFLAPNLLAVNFLLYNVLAGGASKSLRLDTQGKTLALALLEMAIERPENYADMIRNARKGKAPC